MVNMNKTGAYISSLRKEKDMTQVELADKLNVSHQAVSKWERGEYLPDVASLPKLASTLGVSIDDILAGGRHQREKDSFVCGEGDVVMEIAQGNPEKVEEGQLDFEVLETLAPFLGKGRLTRLVEKIFKSNARSDE